MTHKEDIKRQWDGLEDVESVKRIANILDVPREKFDFYGFAIAGMLCVDFWLVVTLAFFALERK